MLLANFNRKEHLRHRAVSLRQHGFLVTNVIKITVTRRRTKYAEFDFSCAVLCCGSALNSAWEAPSGREKRVLFLSSG